MNKYYFLIVGILFFGFTNAQVINIPNANFKSKLINSSPNNTFAKNLSGNYFKIDANNDDQIQQSEALNVSYLDVSNSNISSLTGINFFPNLIFLNCGNNQLSNLNVSSNTLLQSLFCYVNFLSSLNVNSNPALTYLWCAGNQITSLNTDLNLNLSKLYCRNNYIQSLNLTNNTNLVILNCGFNNFNNLNLSSNLLLEELQCNNLGLTNLDVTVNQFLTKILCYYNSLTTLDLSNNILLTELQCSDNQLTSLNIKNGSQETSINFSQNPNLGLICVDPFQIGQINYLYPFLSGITTSNCSSLLVNAQDNLFKKITVSPNPAKEVLIFNYNQDIAISSVSIYNVLGQLVQLTANAKDIKTIDVYSLKPGNYFVKVISNVGISSSKFVKE